jgi:hypothetical protein
VTLEGQGEAGNKAEAGQLEDETVCLSSNMAKNQPKRRVQSLDELSVMSKSCTIHPLQVLLSLVYHLYLYSYIYD